MGFFMLTDVNGFVDRAASEKRCMTSVSQSTLLRSLGSFVKLFLHASTVVVVRSGTSDPEFREARYLPQLK